MNIFNRIIYFLLSALMLHSLSGCSSDNEPSVSETPPDGPANEVVIYEANPGLFGNQGALKSITARLDNIKALGVNTLWLMPIYEQGKLNAFGSPYCVKDYKAVNAEFGTLADLKALVSAAHGKGMRVILDWMANHTSWDHAWMANKAWYTQDAGGNIISPPGFNWTDVADLNYANADMRAAMIDAMLYWVAEADVDGYRCDYADGVPTDFWSTAIAELRKLKGDNLLMLAESGDASFFQCGFDLVYGWNFAYKLQDVYAGKATPADLYATHNKEQEGVPAGKQRMRHTTNHDMASEKSPLQVYGGADGALSAFVIAATMGGSPMIYSSQEIGYDRPLSFFNHVALDWNSNPDYQAAYTKLMSVYNASDALRRGTLTTYANGKVATYVRKSQKETVLVMVNTSAAEETAKLPIEYAHEEAHDPFTSATQVLPSVLTLAPYQYYIRTMN